MTPEELTLWMIDNSLHRIHEQITLALTQTTGLTIKHWPFTTTALIGRIELKLGKLNLSIEDAFQRSQRKEEDK